MGRQEIEIRTADGVCKTVVFRPEGDGPWPAVIVYCDAFGPRPAMEEIGARLAANGYFTIVPDIFYRAGEYGPIDARAVFADRAKAQALIGKMIAAASPANVVLDTASFLDYLAAQPDVTQPKVGTTGYCMGGNRSLHVAAAYPDRIAAAASYHGGNLATDAPDSPHLGAPHIKARVYVAGAVEDQSFSEEQKARLIAALEAAGVRHTVETYAGARHGWVPTDFPVHDPAAAERHFQTMLALFNETLR